jgi:hypothetical protein
MTRRTPADAVAANVATAIEARGLSAATVSEATDIPISDLNDRLSGVSEFNVEQLESVGGFLRICPTEFLKGAA